MSDSYTVYRNAVRGGWADWWLTWPLVERVAVGDVLHNVGGQVRAAGALSDRGVNFSLRPGVPRKDYLHDAQGTVSVRFKTAGVAMDGFTALAVADLGAAVEFTKSKSALVVYTGLAESGVADHPALAAELVRLSWDTWDDSLLAVSQVVTAQSGILMTSAASMASAEVRLHAGAGQAQLGLADLAAKASILRAEGLSERWTGGKCTPFFRVVRLRKRWFRDAEADYAPRQPGRGAGPVPVPPVLLEEALDDPDAVLETVEPEEQLGSEPSGQ